MSKLLHIQASPRVEQSHSRAVADAFVAAYRETHPGDEVVTLDLFKADLPAFDGAVVQAKYAILRGQEHTDEERTAWKAVETVIEQFTAAGKYVLSTPMWNFGVPYRLKQYIDILVQPTYTFSFSPGTGYAGLVTGKPILVVSARGGEYGPGTPAEAMDFQWRYLNTVLGFIGFTDVRAIDVEPTMAGGPEIAARKKTAAIAAARQMATTF